MEYSAGLSELNVSQVLLLDKLIYLQTSKGAIFAIVLSNVAESAEVLNFNGFGQRFALCRDLS